ncbi:MAG: HD-GYP domain-containing protein [bacterium]
MIEYNTDPALGIFLSKMHYVFFWAYFILAPMLISALTEEKLQSIHAVIFLSFAIISGLFTVFSDLIISSKLLLYNNLNIAKTGILYPFVATALFILCVYYYRKFLIFVNKITNFELRIIMPVGLGLCIFAGMIDYAGKLRGTPIIPWLGDPFSLGMLSISLSFSIFLLFSYSQIISDYRNSLSEIEQLLQTNHQTLNEFVQLVAKTIDAKDKYTAGHSMRVAEYSARIARVLNLDEEQIKILYQACLLHDIGKIGIPDNILNKKTPLSDKDRLHIYRHPVLGKEILSKVTHFHNILDVIYAHHERVDGTGYPEGLKREEIPLLARILAVADAYDAMLSERPYRPAKTKIEAIKELLNARDKQLDAQIVDKFIEILCRENSLLTNNLSN